MILQALYEYYKRKENDSESGIAPEGFGYVEIPFFIEIDRNGNFLGFIDTRGTDLVGKKFLVPVLSVTRTRAVVANLLWDNAKYCLGIADYKQIEKIKKDWNKLITKDPSLINQEDLYINNPISKLEKDASNCFLTFVKNIEQKSFANNPSIEALLKFLNNNPADAISKKEGDSEAWNIIKQKNLNVSFWIRDDKEPLVSLLHDCIENENRINQSHEHEGVCLITGERMPIEMTHPLIKGVANAQPSGASIVSFNNRSFTSFIKDQNLNAPVSKSATFAYTTALNMMLAKDSQNKMRVGDATAVFWSAKKTEFETFFSAFWGYSKDNPDADILAVKQLYNSINTGAKIPESDTKFYVLGLSPNAARLSIRFWHTGTIAEFSNRIKQHFDDLEIVRSKKESEHYSLFWMLSAIALEHKTENVPPNLSGEIVNAILAGTPYPTTLQHQCIRRIRAEQDVGRIRASLLKAYLNRRNRFYKSNEKELTVALDTTNENIGYRLGRLFATFEKLQEDTQPGINATIKDRYYGAASSTPCTVFPQLFKLKNHHLAKLVNVGQKVNYEKLIGEITSGIPADGMPAHLNLDDQSRFAIGYYHQRQEFFKAKEDKQ